ncbi:MAG TPA: MarR family transcriptional regulator [Actinomycetota bacterium]|nr:MarR family transcriptional regulator [Actinomycetota bacterium]
MRKDEDLLELADGLHSASVRLLRRVRSEDQKSGLSPARLSVLSVLAFSGPLTVGRLAAAEGVRSPTMTGIVNGLVEQGLVERRSFGADQRAVEVAITRQGQQLFNAARKRRVEAVAALLEPLSPDDRDQIARTVAVLKGRLG